MKFLEFKNFDDFKTKMNFDGNEAIIFMLNEIEKIERRINSHLSGSNKSKKEDDGLGNDYEYEAKKNF